MVQSPLFVFVVDCWRTSRATSCTC